jgi:SAM-dependent methyltransferase
VNAVKRGRFQGTIQIVQYNWDFYLAGLVAITAIVLILLFARMPILIEVALVVFLGLSSWWWLGSLVASYWAYDASDLMKWGWVAELAAPPPASWINLHAGLDESTPELAALWGPPLAVYDFHDAVEMTEPSIRRARALGRNLVQAQPAPYENLPVAEGSISVAAVCFAANELRVAAAREAFFQALFRALASGGRLIVVEHLRDQANFVAFGPGFKHFMPRSEWFRLAGSAGFKVVEEVRKTPFVVAFVMEKP